MIEIRNGLAFNDYLDSLLNQTESDDLEFKCAAGGFPGSFWDTYSAFCADDFVTNESLRVILNIHKAEIADLLKDMCKNGLLVQEGYGRGTKYRLPLERSKVASSTSKVASSVSKVASSNYVKQRMVYSELKKRICSFCSDWVSIDELAEELHRKRTYLRNKIIPKMLDDNSLEMMFPKIPKHPRQKYKTIMQQ